MESQQESRPWLRAIRNAIGGLLMGLANLVPGISGGTLLLAVGIYPQFINAISEVTRLKFKKDSLTTLGAILLAAAVAVISFAGPVKQLVVYHRWAMYSLFIGLTLGGVPVIWRLLGRRTAAVWISAAIGFAAMGALAWEQASGAQSSIDRSGFWMLFLAGGAGAGAMILPGISGGYLLLLLGVYVPILGAISDVVHSARQLALDHLVAVFLGMLLPVMLGVIVGVVAISNLLRFLLAKFEKATLGILLGLLIGAIVGLWPFQRGVEPRPGDTIKSQIVTQDRSGRLVSEHTGRVVRAEDYPTARFSPTISQVGGALLLVLGGFATTVLIGRLAGNTHPDNEGL